MKAGFQVVRESFYRLLSKQVNGETQKQVAGWKESSFSSSSPQVAAFTFEPNFSSLPEAVVADPATKPMIQVKLVAMSAYEVAIYAKKTPPPPPGTSIAVANPVITCKINLPTNFSYSTSDVVYLPEEELHRIDTQLYNEVIVRMFPPLTESPMLSFISESSLIHIASFLLVSCINMTLLVVICSLHCSPKICCNFKALHIASMICSRFNSMIYGRFCI